jgi:hypothetical protein
MAAFNSSVTCAAKHPSDHLTTSVVVSGVTRLRFGVRGNETADGFARDGYSTGFVGLEPAVGVSGLDLRNKIGRWLGNQHRRRRQDLGSSQRPARELISGPSRGTRVRFLSFNRVQSRAVTGHNTLRRHLQLMRLTDSPLQEVRSGG